MPLRARQLPRQPNPLIGRDQELCAVAGLLADDACRSLTLIGPAGVGKTRLALAAADRHAPAFSDGVRFVDLSTATDVDALNWAIAGALGIAQTGPLSPGRIVLDALHDRSVLLILDNFEQLLPSAALKVSELLTLCPELKLLVTSREPLRLRWERVFTVTPLRIPENWDPARLGSLARVPAVALFVARARAVRPDFALTSDNAGEIAHICALLDGVPLALELAAGQIEAYEPREITARLRESRLDLLVSDARDASPRHRTARGAIAWSYELLTPAERRLFAATGVFAGGFTAAAAAAVCTGSERGKGDLRRELLDLARRGMLSLSRHAGGELRFSMLATLREFALERLAAEAVAHAVCERHAAHYLAVAEAAEAGLRGIEERRWVEELARERNDLRAALSWFLEQHRGEEALRLATAVASFWGACGHLDEGQRWLDEALARGDGAPSVLRARALHAAGDLARGRGDLARAAKLHAESLDLWRTLEDRRGVGHALHGLARVAREAGDHDLAQRHAGDALALFRELGDDRGVGSCLITLGMIARERGALEDAEELFVESLALLRRLDDRRRAATCLNNLAMIASARCERARAVDLCLEGLLLRRDLGLHASIGASLVVLARVVALAGGWRDAVRMYAAAELLRERAGFAPTSAFHDEMERTLDEVKARVGKRAVLAAWTAGRELDLAEIMELARAAGAAVRREPSPASPRGSVDLGLSPRESEVAALVARGLSNRQIAEALSIAERTAETHVGNILGKLELRCRTEVAARVLAAGGVAVTA